MGTNGEKDNGLVFQTFTKTILAVRNVPAFLADRKNDAEVSVDPGAPAPAQVELAGWIGEFFGVMIGIGQDSFHTVLYLRPYGTVPLERCKIFRKDEDRDNLLERFGAILSETKTLNKRYLTITTVKLTLTLLKNEHHIVTRFLQSPMA